MAPSVAYTRASTTLTSSRPSVLRALTSSNTKCHRVTTVRTLWWWGKHGSWSSSNDENFEERLHRRQKIMLHRYCRAMKRRAMWERDDNIASWTNDYVPTGRFGRRLGAILAMSSSASNNARIVNPQKDPEKSEKYWADIEHKYKFDYDAWKAAVDRAIAKDPYAALFGTRLQGPSTGENSSWISWLINRWEPMEEQQNSQEKKATQSDSSSTASAPNKRKIEIEVLDRKLSPTVPAQPEAPKSTAPSFSSNVMDEYKYDPISGRKVLQSSINLDTPSKPPQSFLETLFSEHGAELDKPVKQHQVHGHQPTSSKPLAEDTKSEVSSITLNRFGSSRAHEYQQLRAATIGNSIDTTAVFGDRFEDKPDSECNSPVKRDRKAPEPEDDTPLFLGTTYESKADQIMSGSSSRKPSWLQKEGFQNREAAGVRKEHVTNDSRPARLEPSFDRMQATTEIKKKDFITKLQPAIDRVQVSKPKETSKHASSTQQAIVSSQKNTNPIIAAMATNFSMQSSAERGEDIDLLRASDVRAGTKTVRTTKQETEQAKARTRSQLEDSFDQVHKQLPEEFIPEAKDLRTDSGKLVRSIEMVHKHAHQYPNGVVAKTMRSIGMIDHKYKDHQRPHSTGKLDLTERLEFGSAALNKLPSIYTRPAQSLKIKSASDMQIVQKEIKGQEDITEALRLSTKISAEAKKREDAQIIQLANGIRQIYETEYGPIDLSPTPKSVCEVASQRALSRGSQSLQDPTEFEVEQAKFLSEVSGLSRDVQGVKTKTAQLEKEWKNKSISSDEASSGVEKLTAEANSYVARADALQAHLEQRSEAKRAHPLSTATVKPGVKRYPAIERHTQLYEPSFIRILQDVKSMRQRLLEWDSILHDLQRSRRGRELIKINEVPANGQPKKSEAGVESHVSRQTTVPSLPFLILAYNKTTGKVDTNAMDRLPWSVANSTETVNPIKIMRNLNYPAAFVSHFVELEKAGYELSSGGGDMLIFSKKSASTNKTEMASEPVAPSSQILRNSIAAEEASAQPEITETVAQPRASLVQQAATVLDTIPSEIPQPSPAPPTVPPANSGKRAAKASPKVRRQEQVFSGTIPLRKPKAQKPEASHETASSSTKNESNSQSTEQDEPLFTRTTRAIKRGVLGVAAIGATMYTVGVVTEGLSAQAQVEGDATMGPRRKMVMSSGQRPGIYSTESSRND